MLLNELRTLWRNEAGQEMIEYALLAAVVALAGGAVIPPMAPTVTTIFLKAVSVLGRFS